MRKAIAAALAVTGTATLLYWVLFLGGVIVPADSECYMAWERSFPLADLWMVGCALAAAIGLWRGAEWGTRWALVAAGAMIFLGLIDLLFALENGLYLTPTGAPMAVIPAWVTGLGIAIVLIARDVTS